MSVAVLGVCAVDRCWLLLRYEGDGDNARVVARNFARDFAVSVFARNLNRRREFVSRAEVKRTSRYSLGARANSKIFAKFKLESETRPHLNC